MRILSALIYLFILLFISKSNVKMNERYKKKELLINIYIIRSQLWPFQIERRKLNTDKEPLF